jgi:hypothetical protein
LVLSLGTAQQELRPPKKHFIGANPPFFGFKIATNSPPALTAATPSAESSAPQPII